MILNAFEQKTALDYIVYMMMGSHFRRCSFPAKYREKKMEHFYMLLGSKLQIELEEKTENCFLKTIRPSLPQEFLNSEVKAFWISRGDGRQSSVVFASHIGQLWVVTRYGGRLKMPEYYHFYMNAEESRKAGNDRVEALWKKLSPQKKNGRRRARKKRPA